MNSVDGVRSTGQVAPVSPSPVPVDRLPEQWNLIQAVRALNMVEYFGKDQELTMVLDREKRGLVVRIIDKNTGQVIRQVPPDYVLDAARDAASEG